MSVCLKGSNADFTAKWIPQHLAATRAILEQRRWTHLASANNSILLDPSQHLKARAACCAELFLDGEGCYRRLPQHAGPGQEHRCNVLVTHALLRESESPLVPHFPCCSKKFAQRDAAHGTPHTDPLHA